MADSRPELERELNDLRREVIEARNLVIKTDNLLKNLHAEMKMVSERQRDFQQRQWVSSAVAYALFLGVCAGGSLFFYLQAQASSSRERDRLEKARAELTAELEKQKAESGKTAQASRDAAEAYNKMTNLLGDERLRGIDQLAKLEKSRLTPLERTALDDRAVALRKEVGLAAFERGRAAFRRNEMKNAVAELTRFLAMSPAPPEALETDYMLGCAYNQLRKPDQAALHMNRFLSGEKRAKNRDYAMLVLATSYEQTRQPDKALAVLREALANYPNSQFAPQLKNRLVAIKRATGSGSEAASTVNALPQKPSPE